MIAQVIIPIGHHIPAKDTPRAEIPAESVGNNAHKVVKAVMTSPPTPTREKRAVASVLFLSTNL